jgi:hypothetical protein
MRRIPGMWFHHGRASDIFGKLTNDLERLRRARFE